MRKLPEKWQIKVTPENRDMLNEYRKTLPRVDLDYTLKGYLLSEPKYDRSYMNWTTDGELDYTIITDEEFKYHILGVRESSNNYSIY